MACISIYVSQPDLSPLSYTITPSHPLAASHPLCYLLYQISLPPFFSGLDPENITLPGQGLNWVVMPIALHIASTLLVFCSIVRTWSWSGSYGFHIHIHNLLIAPSSQSWLADLQMTTFHYISLTSIFHFDIFKSYVRTDWWIFFRSLLCIH